VIALLIVAIGHRLDRTASPVIFHEGSTIVVALNALPAAELQGHA